MTLRKSLVGILGLIVLSGTAWLLAADSDWKDTFNVSKQNFSSTGNNPYFVLQPGYELRLEGKEDGKNVVLVITVLDETKTVDGVETRIIEENESADGKPVEISRNYFAIDKTTNAIYYFGEDVDEYTDGKVTAHGGSWLSGKDGAKYGMMMPGVPKVGDKFYEELAPKVAMDRSEIQSISETVKAPAGTFQQCVKTEETTPLEASTKEYKLYAPGIGQATDGDLKLVKYGQKAK